MSKIFELHIIIMVGLILVGQIITISILLKSYKKLNKDDKKNDKKSIKLFG